MTKIDITNAIKNTISDLIESQECDGNRDYVGNYVYIDILMNLQGRILGDLDRLFEDNNR